ncbi:MAG: N4-gp56 family major capsid protein [Oscillospiraceae bacterium]|nr:MAG: N4-gp56 family major capsid protein [Oscillospiraceae bacterium]
MKNIYKLFAVVLTLFDGNTNVTTDVGLTEEMKTYYSDYLIDNAEPELVHDQFGQKRPIPKNGGKTIQFRKYDSLPKALTPLVEGKTPDGQKLNMSVIEATVKQYGAFIELADILMLTAIDNNLLEATVLLASQAGRSLDTITREVLNGGTNVQYGASRVNARYKLTGEGDTKDLFSVNCVNRAVRFLKVMNAKKFGDGWVAIAHPDVLYDLMEDPRWRDVKTYSDPSGIYQGEVGRLNDVRFVETTEAKIFHAHDLSAASRTLTVKSASSTTVTVNETLTADDVAALAERKVLIGGECFTVVSATTNTLTLDAAPTTTTAGTVIYPGEAGANGRDVYSTLFLGANAYGTTEITGGGLEHIVKQLGSSGTADPLNQRATAGWKATKTAVRLVEQYMVRVETASTFEAGEN